MGGRDELRTLVSVGGDSLDAELELDMYDDDVLLDDDLDDELDKEGDGSKKTGRGQNWRRIELIRDDKLLRLAMADFEDYDFENDDSRQQGPPLH